MARRWRNWAGNVTARPAERVRPRSEAEVASIVSRLEGGGGRAKVIGSGHSFTPAAATEGTLVDVSRLRGVRGVDREALTVRVGAGTVLADLNDELHDLGLAMPNLGDIAYQTVAGAISTGTHGTGAAFGGLAAQVRGFRLVDGRGQVHECSASSNADIFDLGRVSVGALGVVTEYALEVVPSFRLHAVEGVAPVAAVLEQLDDLVAGTDHFEFYWLPHTRWALTKRNTRTQEPPAPLPRMRAWWDKKIVENYGFGALCRLGSLRPSLIPRLATALPSSGGRDWIDDSFRVFASTRIVRFLEMEYAMPRAALPSALNDLMAMVEARGHLVSFPVEVRFASADDVALSTAHDRDSCYVAVHMYRRSDHTAYFRDAEAIFTAHGGRPHWGKMHTRTADDLSALYSRFGDFLALRDRLDPGRVFANVYTERVFGR
jgi:FAD-linked oxidoreductase